MEHCRQVVRRLDWEGYLSTLFLPTTRSREAGWVLRAMNAEIASIRDQVRDRTLGRMRLQWWRESLEKTCEGRPPANPILQPLSDIMKTVEEPKLAKGWLNKLIDARERDLMQDQKRTLEEAETYAKETAGALLNLHLLTLNIRSIHADHVASHLGTAIGLTTLLRSLPHQIHARHVNLPADICAKHGLAMEDVLRLNSSTMKTSNETLEKLTAVVFDIASAAHGHYETAQSIARQHQALVTPSAGRVFLFGVSSARYLKALEKHDFHPWHSSLMKKQWTLPFHLYLHAYKHSF